MTLEIVGSEVDFINTEVPFTVGSSKVKCENSKAQFVYLIR